LTRQEKRFLKNISRIEFMASFEKYFKQNFFGQACQNNFQAFGVAGVLGLLSKKRKKERMAFS